MQAGKEQAVADTIKRLPDQRKFVSRARENGPQSSAVSKSMLGGEQKALSTHFVVVRQIGTAALPLPERHVIRKESREPQRVIRQMLAREKGALRITVRCVGAQRRERVVRLVVVHTIRHARSCDAKCTTTLAT